MPRPKKNLAPEPTTPEPQPRPETKPMPSLLFNEVHFDNPEGGEPFPEPATTLEEMEFHHSIPYRPTPLHSGLLPTNNPPPPRGAQGYMWLSIGIVMAIVIATWIFSLPNHLSLGQFKNGSEFSLLKAGQAKWQATALTPETNSVAAPSSETVSNLEDAIKKLNLADNQAVTPTSTASSTTIISPTASSTPSTTSPKK
jgi:hypothetical protein